MLIDDFLPAYDFRERHRIAVRAPAADVYAAARRLDLGRARLSMLLLRLRGLPAGRRSPRCFTMDDFLRTGFILLGERPPEELLFGLAGRFWTPSGKLIRLDAEGFKNFGDVGYAKSVWNFTLSERADGGGVLLETETRVQCLDAVSRRQFRVYWLFVKPFSGFIRREVLRAIKRSAEESAAHAA